MSEWTLDRFDTGDSKALSLMSLGAEEAWETVPLLAERRPCKFVLGVFSPIMQLERSFSDVLNRSSLPALCMPLERVHVIPALLSALPIGVVVSLWRDRGAVEEVLRGSKNIFHEIVLAPSERPLRYDVPDTGFEVHAVPGLVALLQCGELAGANAFHPGKKFDADAMKTLSADVSPAKTTCSCGRQITLALL